VFEYGLSYKRNGVWFGCFVCVGKWMNQNLIIVWSDFSLVW